jgi:hypothetical protein
MSDDTAARMTEAASAWLGSLDSGQRAKASFAFDDDTERTSWAYFPRRHPGLAMRAQSPEQQKLAHRLLATSLSLVAYAKVNTIFGLESTLNEIEQRRGDAVRDPGRYFFSIFGAPGRDAWGWRVEGHHVALNFTVASDEVISPTPMFLGANPAEITHGGRPVVRPCGEEEDAARELLHSLPREQRAIAVLHNQAPPDIVLSNAPRVPETCAPGELAPPLLSPLFASLTGDLRAALTYVANTPRGIPGAALDNAQRKLLSDLIDVYIDRLPAALAQRERAKIELQHVHFAWAGEDRPRRPHYYRLQGPSFLVEYDNTQDDANHAHAVWRNPANDFGYDALRHHIQQQHKVR